MALKTGTGAGWAGVVEVVVKHKNKENHPRVKLMILWSRFFRMRYAALKAQDGDTELISGTRHWMSWMRSKS